MLLPLVFASLVTGMTVSSPVQVASCEVVTPTFIPQSGDQGGMEQIGNYALRVRFLNTGPEPITRVTFALNDGSTISDVGRFSPNVTINHWLDLKQTNATGCSISSLQLADGSQITVAAK